MRCEMPVVNDFREDAFSEGTPKEGENIALVNWRDPRSIAAALIRLLKNEGLRKIIGAGGCRFVSEHLSREKIAGQMEEFYKHVCSQWRSFHEGSPDQRRVW